MTSNEKRPLPEAQNMSGNWNDAYQPNNPTYPPKQAAPPPPYLPPPGHSNNVIHPNTQQHQTVTTEVINSHKTTDCMRSTIPRLPKCLARTFCVMNCIIPGWGTIGAAFAACCYEQYDHSEYKPCCPKCNSCFGTFCFGILQFATTPFFLLGFVWSILWGLELLKVSDSTKSVVTTTTTTTTSGTTTTHVTNEATTTGGVRRAREHVSEYPTVHLSNPNRDGSQLPPGRV